MERYQNLRGNSEVVAYEIGPDFIRVQFVTGAIYLYTDASADPYTIAYMKQLAVNDQGLHAFI